MKKEIYTPMENILVNWMKALAADGMLVKMEQEQGLMDGIPMEVESNG